VKRRWKVLIGTSAVLLALIAAPILITETQCSEPIKGLSTEGYKAKQTDPKWQRDEARTWLTYPEWHIVYSAESYGRHLATKQPPSGYPFMRDASGFWRNLCAMNRASTGRAGTDAKVMLYTIGISFTAELLVKSAYENTLGRFFEWAGGYDSADDHYSARIQQRYGAFMHETPWYEFPFGKALAGLWRTQEPFYFTRHWERRIALGAEYGFKAGYAKLIGWASGASLGPDEKMLRFLVQGNGGTVAATDRRFRVAGRAGNGLTVIEAPRYAQFTDLMLKLSTTNAELVEISGNDDVFLTVLLPSKATLLKSDKALFEAPLDEPIGWRRVGVSTKVPNLLATIRTVRSKGGRVEHVYDY
jgi:hypothetical protein